MPRIRVTIDAVIRRKGTIELDITDDALVQLRADPENARVWMAYTVAPMIPAKDWKEPLATGLGRSEVTGAKFEEV